MGGSWLAESGGLAGVLMGDEGGGSRMVALSEAEREQWRRRRCRTAGKAETVVEGRRQFG